VLSKYNAGLDGENHAKRRSATPRKNMATGARELVTNVRN
jgi:hypothetical protein